MENHILSAALKLSYGKDLATTISHLHDGIKAAEDVLTRDLQACNWFNLSIPTDLLHCQPSQSLPEAEINYSSLLPQNALSNIFDNNCNTGGLASPPDSPSTFPSASAIPGSPCINPQLLSLTHLSLNEGIQAGYRRGGVKEAEEDEVEQDKEEQGKQELEDEGQEEQENEVDKRGTSFSNTHHIKRLIICSVGMTVDSRLDYDSDLTELSSVEEDQQAGEEQDEEDEEQDIAEEKHLEDEDNNAEDEDDNSEDDDDNAEDEDDNAEDHHEDANQKYAADQDMVLEDAVMKDAVEDNGDEEDAVMEDAAEENGEKEDAVEEDGGEEDEEQENEEEEHQKEKDAAEEDEGEEDEEQEVIDKVEDLDIRRSARLRAQSANPALYRELLATPPEQPRGDRSKPKPPRTRASLLDVVSLQIAS